MRAGQDASGPFAGIVALAVALSVVAMPAAAEDAKISCAEVVKKARAAGQPGQVTIDKEWGLVRIAIPDAFCEEPIEEWRLRRLGWPTQAGAVYAPPTDLVTPKPAPAPVAAAPKPQPPKAEPPKPAPKAEPPKPAPKAEPPKPAPAAVPFPAPAAEPVPAPALPPVAAPLGSPAADAPRSFTVDTSKSMLKRPEPEAPAEGLVKPAAEAEAEPEPAKPEVKRITIVPDLAAEQRDIAAGKATLAPAGISGVIEEKGGNNWIVWTAIGLIVVLAVAGGIFAVLRLRRRAAEVLAEHEDEDEEEEV